MNTLKAADGFLKYVLVTALLFIPGESLAIEEDAKLQGYYFAQQFINGMTLGSIYALLAVGYTLVYRIVGRINLAFGDLSAMGGYATLMGLLIFSQGGELSVLSILLALIVPVGVGLISGALSHVLVFRHFVGGRGQATLVAAIGLAIVIQEYLRISQGNENHWIPMISGEPIILAAEQGFALSITPLQVFLVTGLITVSCLLVAVMQKSRFGLNHRACSQNVEMAALCGVNVQSTILYTYVLATLFAGLSGYVAALYYGVVNFYMGFALGLKALTAAVIGGIGSLRGAFIGGLFIGLVETFWSAYFSIEYRDVAVFGLLIFFLVLKPQGMSQYG